ncbi:MAG: hypothetical protein U0136_15550 [Bdellovibrionota bacterium]
MAASFLDSTGPTAPAVLLAVRAVGFLVAFAAVPNRVLPFTVRTALVVSFVIFLLPFAAADFPSIGELLLLSEQHVSGGGPPLSLTQLLGQLAFGLAFGVEAGVVLFAASLLAKWATAQLSTTLDADFHEGLEWSGFQSLAPVIILASVVGLFDVAPELFRVLGESLAVLPTTVSGQQVVGYDAIAGQVIGALVSFAGSAALTLGVPVFASVFGVSLSAFVAQRLSAAMMSRSLVAAALVPIVLLAVAAQLLRSPVLFADIASDRLQPAHVTSIGQILRKGASK